MKTIVSPTVLSIILETLLTNIPGEGGIYHRLLFIADEIWGLYTVPLRLSNFCLHSTILGFCSHTSISDIPVWKGVLFIKETKTFLVTTSGSRTLMLQYQTAILIEFSFEKDMVFKVLFVPQKCILELLGMKNNKRLGVCSVLCFKVCFSEIWLLSSTDLALWPVNTLLVDEAL